MTGVLSSESGNINFKKGRIIKGLMCFMHFTPCPALGSSPEGCIIIISKCLHCAGPAAVARAERELWLHSLLFAFLYQNCYIRNHCPIRIICPSAGEI